MTYEPPADFWDIQRRGYDGVLAAAANGQRRIVLTAPTGTGKTRLMLALIEYASSIGWQSILYTHRRMLLTQTAAKLEEHYIEFGYRASGYKPALLKSVQLAMLQSEMASVLKKETRNLHDAQLVLIDELHAHGGDTLQEFCRRHYEAGAIIVGTTATPLDLCGDWDTIVIAGTVSDGRKCGALVPAYTYCPDEPDMRLIKKYKVSENGDDLTDKQNREIIMRPGIFGRVFEHWQRLNPDAKPTLLFGPDVGGSLFFAQEFCKHGVRAAHIDAKQIWWNGEFVPSDDDMRAELLKATETGDVQVLCNRFVLREGIDLPHIAHAIFACVVGSLKSWIQMGGRVLRAHPSTPEVCIAKDTPILTDKGLVKIQDITTQHRLWDGVEFVTHSGLAFMGHKRIITWDGLTATPEHKVNIGNAWTTLAMAKARGQRITRTGMGWQAIRVLDYSDPHDPAEREALEGRSGLQQLQLTHLHALSSHGAKGSEGMPEVHAALQRDVPGMALPSSSASMEAMQRSKRGNVPSLRRTGDQVLLPVSLGCDGMDCEDSWASKESAMDAGSNRQRRELRAEEPAMVNGIAASQEYGEVYQAGESLEELQGTLSRGGLLPGVCEPTVLCGIHCGTDCGEMVEVFDIVNAGPRHRFTAANVLVSNCVQDHGANFRRHGSLNENRHWELGQTGYKTTGLRIEAMREKPDMEPIICPKCGMGRLSGPACLKCGYEYHKRSKTVVQIDGTLRQVEGATYKPHYTTRKPDTEKKWNTMYHRAKSQKWDATFRQAAALFFYEERYWPPNNLPLMPKTKEDWFSKVRDVPKERLL